MTKIKILHFLVGLLIGLVLTPFIGLYSAVIAIICGGLSWSRSLTKDNTEVDFSDVAFALYGSVIGYAFVEWVLSLV